MLKSHLKSGSNLSSATGLQTVINNASLAHKKKTFPESLSLKSVARNRSKEEITFHRSSLPFAAG